MQGGGELGEYWRLGNSLQSFDVSGRGHVETTEQDEDYAKDKRWKNHPWTDGKDNSQDTENVESDLSKILIVSYIFLVFSFLPLFSPPFYLFSILSFFFPSFLPCL